MNSAIPMLVLLVAPGVDYGWQPVAGGGIEYIIQIGPHALDALNRGQDLCSDLPPGLRNVQSYRITVGTGRLPHQGEAPPESHGQSELSPRRFDPLAGNLGHAAGNLGHAAGNLGQPTGNPPVIPGTPIAVTLPLGNTAQQDAATGSTMPVGHTISTTTSEPATQLSDSPESPAAAKPWWPLTLTLLGLFASLGTNAYLGWISYGLRQRCQSLLSRLKTSAQGKGT